MTNLHSVIIQFRNSGGAFGLGTLDELDWRHKQELELDNILVTENLGYCDGGQGGAGTMEIFLSVSDISRTVELVRDYLTNQEFIGFCKIVSHEADNYEDWTVHYPPDAQFSMWEF